MNPVCLEKLCGIAAAVGVVGAGALGYPAAAGVLEAMTGAGGLLVGLRAGREGDYRRVLARVKNEVASGYRRWIEIEHRREPWYAEANLDEALRELERVIEHCVPTPREVVGVRLDGEALARLLLDRAARHSPAFAPDSPNPAARAIFLTIVRETYERVRTNPDYAQTLRTYIDEALLAGQARHDGKLDAAHGKLDALLALVQAEKGVPLAVLQTILAKLGERDVPLDPAALQAALEAKAEEFLTLDARLRRLANDDPRVAEMRGEAADALKTGDFTRTDMILAEAERLDLEVVEELEERTRQRRRSAATSRAERAAAARLALDYLAAAAHFAEAAKIAPEGDIETRWRYRLDEAKALYDRGSEFGDNAALMRAIATYRAALALTLRADRPLNWAATQNNLGNALSALGERESGTASLEKAVDAYRAALEERTPERTPYSWAMTKNNLGTALRALGEREGSNTGNARLEEALDAYCAALKVWTREHAPLDWATAQNNLGNVLWTLDEWEGGTTWLRKAVAAYRAALEVWTPERMPYDWAMTQNNLGNALRALGEREDSDTSNARLEEALDAYCAALKVWTRERVPLDWAGVQNNLGTVLSVLGERECGTARLQEAVEAFYAALEECTRERVPLQWAYTNDNLAHALEALALRTGRRELMVEAMTCMRNAAAIYREGGIAYQLLMAEESLARMEVKLAELPAH